MTDMKGTYDLFATEGGTAAMRHCFDSLITNKLLHKGDTIALGIPTFTPYLEMPKLPDYDLKTVEIVADPKNNWQYSDAEIDKLKDRKIKAFFVVNPGNPTSQTIGEETINRLVNLVKHHRPDLMILTDDVYGTFVEGFNSLAAVIPANTLLVYSFSKHMGCTGWRLAVVALHQENIFDKMIAQLPEKEKKLLHHRYSSLTTEPEKLKFIDRMVADSRAVALNHTAGLSLPQQIQMTLFSLFFLLDTKDKYIHETKKMIHTRLEKLYQALEIPLTNDPENSEYYTIIDILAFAERHFDKKFADHLKQTMHPLAFLFALAEKKSVVLLNGDGFGASNWSVRVSLANLNEDDYTLIGQRMKELLQDFYAMYKK
jgi:aspartate 4-decarboxylase